MNSKIKNCIINFDILGPTPSLKIFNEDKFKSFIISIITIIGLALIISFLIYSFIDYLKFNNPTIVYWKDNTQSRNLTLNLSDILLMVQINHSHTLNLNDPYVQLEAQLIVQSSNTTINTNISLER